MADKKSRKKKGEKKSAKGKGSQHATSPKTPPNNTTVEQWRIKDDWEPDWFADNQEIEDSEDIPLTAPSIEIENDQSLANPKADQVRVGDIALAIVRWPPPWLRVIIVLAILGMVAYLLGQLQNVEASAILRRIGSGEQSVFTLIEAREGVVLMWESEKSRSEVLVQASPQSEWLRVSRGDTTAINPALSPDASQVAYLSSADSGQIIVASLGGGDRLSIPVNALNNFAATKEPMSFCDWTTIAWSHDGKRLAFFGCYQEETGSVAFYAQIDAEPIEVTLIPDSKLDTNHHRQLLWSSDETIILTFPKSEDFETRELRIP
jgi:hypothetical protein